MEIEDHLYHLADEHNTSEHKPYSKMVKSSGDSISVSSSSTRRSSARIAKAAAASASENQEDTKAKQQRHQEFKYAKAVQGPKKVPVLSSEYIEQSTSRVSKR